MARKPRRAGRSTRPRETEGWPAGWLSHGALVGACLLAPVVLRVVLLVDHGIEPGPADLRGVLSDLSVALLLALGLAALAGRSRWAALAGAELWTLLCYGNYEHVRALDANVSLFYAGYLGDRVFLEGSALAVSCPGLLAVLAGAVAAFWWLALAHGGRRFRKLPLGAAAILALSSQCVWPERAEIIGWRQAHFVWDNARWLVSSEAALPSAFSRNHLTRDLSGEPMFELTHRGQNVLLIMMESISGAHIERIAADNGRRTALALSNLDRLAGRGICYTNFVSLQRQTNRGEYAVLCGDLPRLGTYTPKMSEPVRRRCLPALLRGAGYRTVYLQAAPLAFMMKDQFMVRAGFDEVLGEPWFGRAYGRSKWGVDDRAFFEQAAGKIEELHHRGQPFFVTVLTVSTHHPYSVPKGYTGSPGAGPFARAAEYADRAVGGFLRTLGAAGVLDDTLVLITSDESAGIQGGVDDFTKILSESWGFLIALVPGQPHRKVADPYMQMDIALSVLDYLGLQEEALSVSGRSLFRRYPEPRSIVFANTFKHLVGGLDRGGALYLCREDFTRCTRTRVPGRRLFAPAPPPVSDVLPAEVGFLRELVAESLETSRSRAGTDLELIRVPAVVPLQPALLHDQLVFGGQNLYAPANTSIDVELEAELRGGAGWTYLTHDLVDPDTRAFRRTVRMEAGDRVTMRYTYRTRVPFGKIENRLWLSRTEGSDLELVIRRARMRIHPAPELSRTAEPGLEVHELSLARAEGG